MNRKTIGFHQKRVKSKSRQHKKFIDFVYCGTSKLAVPLHPENKTHTQDEKVTTYIIINNWCLPILNSQFSILNWRRLRPVE